MTHSTPTDMMIGTEVTQGLKLGSAYFWYLSLRQGFNNITLDDIHHPGPSVLYIYKDVLVASNHLHFSQHNYYNILRI